MEKRGISFSMSRTTTNRLSKYGFKYREVVPVVKDDDYIFWGHWLQQCTTAGA